MIKRTLLVAAALALSATRAPAQTSNKAQLSPGGTTIAGPGARTLAAGSDEIVFRQSDATPLDLCATVVNTGKRGTVALVSVVDPSMTYNASSADAGEAAAACRKASNVVRLSCTGGEQCQVLWRVDQSR